MVSKIEGLAQEFAEQYPEVAKQLNTVAVNARSSGVPEELTTAGSSASKPEVVLPERSKELLEVTHILKDNGFDVAPVVYIDKKRGEVTHAVIETIVRPNYTDGTQMYYQNPDQDPLAKILERGRAEQKIAVPDWTRHIPSQSRFGVSWDEVHGFIAPEVIKTIPYLAEQVTKSGIVLRVPTKVEFQDVGKKYPHFGEANSWEWLYDNASFGCHLVSGGRDDGGLRAVSDWLSGHRDGAVAFRFQAVSPSQKLPR